MSLPQLEQATRVEIRANSSLDDTLLAPLRNVESLSLKIVSNSTGPSLLSPCPWPGDWLCDETNGDCAPGTDSSDCSPAGF